MTATEVRVRYELMQRLLGPTLGRLQNDFLDPLITRTFNIMLRAGALDPPPDEARSEEGTIDIEYTGPLAKSQRMAEVESMERWVSNVTALAEIYPEIRDLVDIDDYGRELADTLGTPSKVVRDAPSVKKIRDARAKAAAEEREAMMAQQTGMAGEAIGKGVSALKDGMGEEKANEFIQRTAGGRGG